MLTEPTIARLTEPVIAQALEGFELAPIRPVSWIARATQGALYCTLKNVEDGPERQSNTETRDELNALALRARDLWRDIHARSPAADSALFYSAFSRWDGEGGTEIDGSVIGEPSDYSAFTLSLNHLEGLARTLGLASEQLEEQKGPWRNAERREQRVVRACFLSPVYELSYGREPTINERPLASSLGPWPDFYSRIVSIAFGKHETSNLRDVLKEARRRDKSDRVQFASGIIPE